MEVFIVFDGLRQQKTNPILFSPQIFWGLKKKQNNEKNRWKREENDENLSLSWKNKPNLRKGKMDVYIYMKRSYEDFSVFGRRKNKANSKPILFSPQIYLGVEDWVEKTKPIHQALGRIS